LGGLSDLALKEEEEEGEEEEERVQVTLAVAEEVLAKSLFLPFSFFGQI
jgi:hypothetical protein